MMPRRRHELVWKMVHLQLPQFHQLSNAVPLGACRQGLGCFTYPIGPGAQGVRPLRGWRTPSNHMANAPSTAN
jgi:hypothetical protein